MNSCRRISCSQWRLGLNIVLHRSQTTTAAAGHQDLEQKPRLRAVDLARKIRQEKEKEKEKEREKEAGRAESSQQRKVSELKQLSQQLQQVHPNVLAKHLSRSLLYQDQDLVVLNKPYGVPLRDESGGTSISSVLPVLCKIMSGMKIKSDAQLFPCLGLEKEISGALLLARTEEVVEHMLNLSRYNQVQRTYWVVTVGVPVPSEGVIDIPIIEKEVTGSQPHYKEYVNQHFTRNFTKLIEQMALSPRFRVNDTGQGVARVRGHREASPAVTKYKVLDSSSGCSLVELQPLTGVKHQIRVHMAHALSCPILGDHKYSHWSKLAPQKLPDRVLEKLGLEQSKSRHVPLHAFSRQLTLPRPNKVEISVSCPLPKYFRQTLNQLLLNPPPEDKKK